MDGSVRSGVGPTLGRHLIPGRSHLGTLSGSLVPPYPYHDRVVETVLLAEPRGFCAGVEMAIKALTWMVGVFEPPVYCYHEIVHNAAVVSIFRRAGVVFVDSIDDVPAGCADHAFGPRILTGGDCCGRAKQRSDGRCGVPSRHQGAPRGEAARRRGYAVIYVGHRGHDEAVGTMAVAPNAVGSLTPPPDSVDSHPLTQQRWPCLPRPRSVCSSGMRCSPRQRPGSRIVDRPSI